VLILIPELQPDGAEAVAKRQRRRGLEPAGLVGGLQVVVRDPRAQVVDVVEPDVAGEEAEDPREFEVGASV
jgi:hypothetical protein